MSNYDTIIIGAGHNGLAAATRLAQSGQKVLVLEQAATPGGAIAQSELEPGVFAPRFAHLLMGLGTPEIKALGLQDHGCTPAVSDMPTIALCPTGRHVVLQGGTVHYADGTPHPDAAQYQALTKRLTKFAAGIAQISRQAPPALTGGGWRQALDLGKIGLNMRLQGKDDLREFMRVALSNVYDAVLDEITDGPLAGVLGFDAILGGHMGPRAPGTMLSLLTRMREGARRSLPKGGMGALAASFTNAAIAAGVEIRCNSKVFEISVANDQVTGIVLQDGSRLACDQVLSSLDPKTTMHLSHILHYDAEMVRRVRHIRTKGAVAKVNLALSNAPKITGLDESLAAARWVMAPSMDALELGYNGAKYGRLPDDVIFEAVVPSLSDPSITTGGHHVLSAIVQYVPYELKQGWDTNSNTDLGNRVIAALDKVAPGLADSVTAREVISPQDIEIETGAPGGHWHHGELIADQMLMMRPAPGMERYALPVSGLFLCGASAHPGGDVTALPGLNAADAVLAGLKRKAA
ncbi:MAG: phytoene dehydrogenase [Rhodospirillaceae bacterium]|jgi:phytoene dehydrogenase-like protein|uniref:phytoene desaturase family protein n=1 Tax=Hwanghaeella sp. 1Z406 TaxID=3402811 RepID=UPI000C54F424|nr:phytoene dehydrogenase [Rhodospirillales bacterium]MAX46896.1 phytoene dehydrogenase [Rhodospirillaceae bacterium]|tara:strand:+ start:151986 stop:153545 length:1560 start_codon:yes stop_codon:yes gene_type:complete